MNGPLLMFFALALTADAGHLELNPVYRALVEQGVDVGGGVLVRLPAPTMADGLSPEAARAAIEAIPDRHAPVDLLVRPSVVAPLVFRFREIEAPGAAVPVHGVDVWCVAHGKWDVLGRKDFLEELRKAEHPEAEARVFTAEELRSRGVTPPPENDENQRYVYGVFPLLDRVQLAVAARSHASRAEGSSLVAVLVDPRFQGDKQFPNQWRSMTRDADGAWQLGPPKPYSGAAAYLKLTRLSEPAGAIFIEYHLVFTEPEGWFSGANLLRSKLPILIQSEVRNFRRRLAKASEE